MIKGLQGNLFIKITETEVSINELQFMVITLTNKVCK